MERRAYPRIDTRLRCELERGGRIYEGFTVNMSRTGVLIELAGGIADFSVGDDVILRIAMPERPLFEPKCMECTSVVCRAVPSVSNSAIALVFETVRFRSAEKMQTGKLREDSPQLEGHVN